MGVKFTDWVDGNNEFEGKTARELQDKISRAIEEYQREQIEKISEMLMVLRQSQVADGEQRVNA